MRTFILIAICLMLFATPVFASYYHEVTIELEGEWTLDSSFAAPEVVSTISLTGTGKVIIHAITAAKDTPGEWWRLF